MGGVRKKISPGNSRVKSMVESFRVLERERRRLALCTSFTVAVWRIKPEKYSRSKEAEISVCLFLVRAESGQLEKLDMKFETPFSAMFSAWFSVLRRFL